MKMDAIVKETAAAGLRLKRVEVPTIKNGEALLEIHKTAICGTDVHIYNWDNWAQSIIRPPLIIGHEFVGKIVEIKGEHDNAFKVGDMVSGEGHVICGECRNCRAGRRHLCPNTNGIGVNTDGIFAEYAAVPLSNLWLCDGAIDENAYAIFDPFGNAAHTALTYDCVGEDILITGAGPTGIMAAQICRHIGAKNIVITDISDFRLELAKTIVPSIVPVNTSNTKIKDVQRQIGMREGFDVGLEMSGSGTALSEMIDNMITGGKIAVLGLFGDTIRINWNKIVLGSLKITGIYGREMFETWHKMTSMVKSGLDITKIITHRFKYTDFEKGFEIMRSGMSGKIILDWKG